MSTEVQNLLAFLSAFGLIAGGFVAFVVFAVRSNRAQDDRDLRNWEARQRALYQEREAEHERRGREREAEYQRKRQEQADEFERNRLAVAQAALQARNARADTESATAEKVSVKHNEPVPAPSINLPSPEALESMGIFVSDDESD